MIGLAPEPTAIQNNGSARHAGSAEKPQRKVFIAIPIMRDPDVHFFHCAMHLQEEMLLKGVHGQIKDHVGDSAVARARNTLTREFLESDCSHILFIDSDFVFSVDQIKRLMDHDEPIVGGLYCKKQQGLPPQLVLNATFKPCERRPDGLMEVRYIGTGFLRVAREVFEKMIEVYGDEISYPTDWDNTIIEWDFWRMGVYKYPDGTKRYLTEDWFFCQMALDLGYKVFADMAVLLKHSGNALYPLDYQERVIFPQLKSNDEIECPPDCLATIHEAQHEYRFPIELNSPAYIVDIGANIGAFAKFALQRWPKSTVVCYEPNPEIFPYLERNCQKMGAVPINSAVGDMSLTDLFYGKSTRLSCSQHQNGDQISESIPIRVVSPSTIPKADLIKIDTEGSECEIVEGLSDLPIFLIVEFHGFQKRQRLNDFLNGKMRLIGENVSSENNGVLAFERIGN